MMNELIQRGWFWPYAGQPLVVPPRPRRRPYWHAGEVYDIGPLDGLRTTSMWAQRMAQIPLVNYAQQPVWLLAGRGQELGEKPVFCEPGHIPVQTGVPGQSKCVPYSPPSAMIGGGPQTTVSTTVPPAYPTGRTFPVGPYWGWEEMSGASRRTALGQMQAPYVTQEERNRLLVDIQGAHSKVKAIDDLMAWSGNNDPGLRTALGLDASRFLTLSNTIAPLYQSVRDVMDRMSESEAEYWWALSDEEAAAVRQWTTGINEMHRIYALHKDQPLTLPPGVPAPPGFTRTSPAPATQRIPGTPAGAPAAPPAKGLDTGDILLGGGLAVGLGLLLFAVTS